MLLSVLIPVYRLDAGKLLHSLDIQLRAAGILYEILVFDDSGVADWYHWHRETGKLQQLKIYTETRNLGRSRSRNFLLDRATGTYVLFLDGDMSVRAGFIAAYLREMATFPDTLLLGGICYEGDSDHLRVRVGKARESVTAARRQQFPYRAFTVANAWIPQKALNGLRFNEAITGYGHEDTLFGLHLQEAGAVIRHLDNPAVHTGIDDDAAFLAKTDAALETLAELYTGRILPPHQVKEIKLLRLWRRLKPTGLLDMFTAWVSVGWLRRRVLHAAPLYWFDLYKIHRLHTLLKQKSPQRSL